LIFFSGKSQYNTVRLDWTTLTEFELRGFNILRSETLNGVKQKRNASLLEPTYLGQNRGSEYQFVDPVDQGCHYFYWIELVNLGSNDLSEPVELTTDYLMYMPLLQ
jgi:hypothetical protein